MPQGTSYPSYPRCSFPGCVNVYDRGAYFNINAGKQQAGVTDAPDWRCINHIPPEITYPQSLHGEEWILAGRKPIDKNTR